MRSARHKHRGVRAALDDLALIQHDDFIGV
jgi:hypothetical protein